MKDIKGIITLCLIILTIACGTNRSSQNHIPPPKPTAVVKPSTSTTKPTPTSTANAPAMDFSGPPTIVYKTKANYNNKVPVTLSDDKSRIVSYPAPKDVFYNGSLAYPSPLEQGYLLDNRGIGKNVAFLSLTYEEYSNLSQVPTLQDLYAMIIDKDPLTQMCNCGNRNKYNDVAADMNRLIKDNKLGVCSKIK